MHLFVCMFVYTAPISARILFWVEEEEEMNKEAKLHHFIVTYRQSSQRWWQYEKQILFCLENMQPLTWLQAVLSA